eukprot:6508256-Pyramimonas_sp.AAC.1
MPGGAAALPALRTFARAAAHNACTASFSTRTSSGLLRAFAAPQGPSDAGTVVTWRCDALFRAPDQQLHMHG